MLTADQIALAGGVFALLAGVLALVKEARDSRQLRAQIDALKAELDDCRNGAPPPPDDRFEIVRPTAKDIRRYGAGGVAMLLLSGGLTVIAAPLLQSRRAEEVAQKAAGQEWERGLQQLADENAAVTKQTLALREQYDRLTREYDAQAALIQELQKKLPAPSHAPVVSHKPRPPRPVLQTVTAHVRAGTPGATVAGAAGEERTTHARCPDQFAVVACKLQKLSMNGGDCTIAKTETGCRLTAKTDATEPLAAGHWADCNVIAICETL